MFVFMVDCKFHPFGVRVLIFLQCPIFTQGESVKILLEECFIYNVKHLCLLTMYQKVCNLINNQGNVVQKTYSYLRIIWASCFFYKIK